MPKFGFNPSEVKPDERQFGNIPRGEYTVRAIEAELRETSTGGEMIVVDFVVENDSYEGKRIRKNFNIKNQSEKAEQIGHQELVSWATACGKPETDDTDDLMEIPCQALIVIKDGTNGYSARNEIASFMFDKRKAKLPIANSEPPKKETNGGSKWKID